VLIRVEKLFRRKPSLSGVVKNIKAFALENRDKGRGPAEQADEGVSHRA